MFKSARLRLTGLYCVVFFLIFWLFSGGLYLWMSSSFNEAYVSKVSQVRNEQIGNQSETGPDAATSETATIAGDITLSQLRTVILTLNVILLFVVPGVVWLLTGPSLRPVRRSYEQQRVFVADASHELRTPLTIMRAELDLALKKKRTSKQYQAALEATRFEVRRLQRLVDDLLLLAQSDGRAAKITEKVDICERLEQVIQRLDAFAVERDVAISFQKPAAQPIVSGSADMLERLFENILTNAIKYSDVHAAVETKIETNGHEVRVSITDNGRGMTERAVVRAFDRFYRETESRTDDGIGLGLAISKSIVEQHRGSIHINSEPGLDTTVTVTLPLKKHD